MRSINLLRVAFDAEMLRLGAYCKRQGRRVAFGGVAAVFALYIIGIINVLFWQLLLMVVPSIIATLILLGGNIAIMLVFLLLALRNKPSYTELEAGRVRRDALNAARGSLLWTAAIPAGRALLVRRRRRS